GTVRNDMMFIGGAVSIDKHYRHEGYDWWADEEPSYADLCTMTDVYAVAKPRVMITHDCPEAIVSAVCTIMQKEKMHFPSRVRQALQVMWEMHKPELWLFGHYHTSMDMTRGGTRFICLDELEYIDID